ncbi:hypothetical protein GOBAR_DD28526 [Gossypium barbadense]|nr:hypothetical protein GOBAR_DD28526 [Gossypium barbadense]
MADTDHCCSTQLIDGDGEFNVVGLDNFMRTTKFSNCGLSYAVVAIMGPQSSGKSTLLNHLFQTNFREMDAYRGRSQTTKGIWIAHCVGIEPFTIAMDLEGTDGRERGEDAYIYHILFTGLPFGVHCPSSPTNTKRPTWRHIRLLIL